jgi:hypothetical protein
VYVEGKQTQNIAYHCGWKNDRMHVQYRRGHVVHDENTEKDLVPYHTI